eukprot:TRINITY_DN8639_c0_g1_i1.p1 TRINITY_DN8639_c0_g1~~TRINITY_DN8639_c0_g1_i1.p1  ORF type:complete len:212 (+),score=21.60 TRINITY_DN8639_c0_g1_i1:63-638(+)
MNEKTGDLLVYYGCLLLGVGLLFPWNGLINGIDYFDLKFEEYNPAFVLPLVYSVCNLLSFIMVVLCATHISFRIRIIPSFLAFSVILISLTLLELFSSGKLVLFLTTCGFVGVLGFFEAVVQGSVYGLAALFPPSKETTQAVAIGQAWSGLVVSIIRIITKASLPQTDDGIIVSSNIFFFLYLEAIRLFVV